MLQPMRSIYLVRESAAEVINQHLMCVGAYCEVVGAFRQSFYLHHGTLWDHHLQHTYTRHAQGLMNPLQVMIIDILAVKQ